MAAIAARGEHLAQWPTRAVVFMHLEGRPKFVAMAQTLEAAGYEIYRITKTINRTWRYPLARNAQPATDFVTLRRGMDHGAVLRRMVRG